MKNPREAIINRRDLLPILFPNPDEYLFVAGLAGAAKDAAAWTQEADNLIALGGAMGGAIAMGLGMALTATHRKVAVITGDGELLMNAGALATVASAAPENLTIVCIDNGRHGETGGQRGHTSKRTNLAVLAEGSGLGSIMTVSTPEELPAAREFLADGNDPKFLWARVQPGPPADYKRNWNLVDCRLRFRRANAIKL